MEDTVKSILRGQTVVTVDATNYDVLVETIPSNIVPSINPSSSFESGAGESETKNDASYLLELFSNVLSSGKAGYTLNCSYQDCSSTGQQFIHVLSTNWSNQSSFTYIPTFHIICTLKENLKDAATDRICLNMKLVSFSGHPISQQSENLTFAGLTKSQNVEEESMLAACRGSNLLKRFSKGEFQLCKGIPNCNNIETTLRTHGLFSEAYDSVKFSNRSIRCQFAMTMASNDDIMCCDECQKVKEQMELLRSVQIPQEKSQDEIDHDVMEVNDSFLDLQEAEGANIILDTTENAYINVKCPVSRKRLGLLKGITIVEQKDLNQNDSQIDTLDKKQITVETKGGEVDFETLKIKYLEEKENEINQLNRIGKDGRKYTMQRPFETAQQKATKRANKLLDSKRQQQVEKIAAEKLGNHEKKCPICENPFRDVHEFMAHLSKCNIIESSDDEETTTKVTIEGQNSSKHVRKGEVNSSMDGMTRSIGYTLSSENTMSKKKKKWKKGKYAMEPVLPDSGCNICCDDLKGEKFSPHMKIHEKRFNLDDSVLCPSCNEHISKRQLNPHFVQVHANEGGCCIECLRVMPRDQIRSHLSKDHLSKPKNSEGQLCPMCGKRCYFTSDLELHLATHQLPCADPPQQQEEVMCHQCGKVFSHRYKLKQHLTNIHNKTFRHSCPFCNKVFNLRHQLTKHLVTHSDVKPFKCRYCDYKNARKYRVVKHIQKTHQVAGTEEDMELLGGTAKTSEFVHNVFGI